MSNVKTYFSYKSWKSLLDRFQEEVVSGLYKKTDYQVWKELQVKHLKDDKFALIYVFLYPSNYIHNDLTLCVDYGVGFKHFSHNDKSFGSYLFEHCFTKEEKERMGYYTTDTLKTNTITADNGTCIDHAAATASSECIAGVAGTPIYNGIAETHTISDLIHGGYVKPDVCAYDSLTATKAASSYSTIIDGNTLTDKVATLTTSVEDLRALVKEKNTKKKENDNMKGFNFDFGPITSDNVRMSIYGIAVKNSAGTYVSYNPQAGEIMDVDILNFDGSNFMYKVPVGLANVQPGDVIVHNRKPMIVEKNQDKDIAVIDVFNGERKTIMPTRSPFGFNFITKVISIMDMGGNQVVPSQDAPFGNMLPFMLMANGDNNDMSPMMMAMMMGGMNMNNPMMWMFMMNSQENQDMNMKDMLPWMFMMNNQNNNNNGFGFPNFPLIIQKQN